MAAKRTPVLCIVLLALLAYLPVLRNGFVHWDDDKYVLGSPRIQTISLANIKDILDPRFTPSDPFPEYQPLRDLSYLVEHALWGTQPRGYQLTSLLLHVVNALALYLLFCALAGPRVALWVALLFACNPVHVESVARIASRKDQLGMLFSTLSAAAFLHWEQIKRRGWYLAALLGFVCALLSKSQAVMLPLILLTIRWWRSAKPLVVKEWLRPLAAFLVVAVFYVGWFLWMQFSRASLADYYSMGFAPHPVAVIKTFGMFAQIILLPFNLSPYHDVNAMIGRVDGWFVLSVLWLIGFVAAVVIAWRRRHPSGIALLLCGLQLLPVLNILPHPVWVAERYTYFAAPFLYWAVLEGVRGVKIGASWRRYAGYAVLALFAVLTWRQTAVWHNPVSFAQAIVKRYPKSLRGQHFLAENLLAGERVAESVATYKSILTQDSTNQLARFNLASIYYRLRQEQLALPLLQAFQVAEPHNALGAAMLGKLHMRLGDDASALPYLQSAAGKMPHNVEMLYDLGLCLARLERYKAAEEAWLKAEQLDPQHLEVLRNLAVLYGKTSQPEKAALYFDNHRKALSAASAKP